MTSQIYLGQVMHQRFFPMQYQFRYGVMSLRIDIDRIEAETAQLKRLSLNRFNLFSLNYADYGRRLKDQAWRVWADELLAEYGLPEPAKRIELVCFPRFMNITFNPLAMWYAYNAADEMVGIIAEVSNTFGQWHHYVLTQGGEPLADKIKVKARKVFHVSPFIGMDCWYNFRFHKPGEHYKMGIYQTENGQPVLTSTQVAQASALTDKNLFKAALKHPFNTLKVVVMIHWWALKIWLKGGTFHKTPKQQAEVDYSHTEMTLC